MTAPTKGPLDTTLIETRDPSESPPPLPLTPVLCLIVIWSRDEPERVGEGFALPESRGRTYTIGRAVTPETDGALPLTLGRMRPSGREDTGPLRAAHVSRRQLALTYTESGLLVEQIGRGALRLNGHTVDRGLCNVGDLIEVEGRFLLLASQRPGSWLKSQATGEALPFPFGAADRWGIVGETPIAWALREQAAFLASRDEHVLVLGPSGSGKELVVQAIHALSGRSAHPLIARNAATIPETLIDAELFGNLKNYPNPGMPERPGLLGEADGSTLFLDEIGELPQRMQAHLLRVMDRGEYQRLGESHGRSTRVRIAAATNRDTRELKPDFLARFAHRIRVPGLSERPEDIALIARHLVLSIGASDPGLVAPFLREGEPTFSPRLVEALIGYRFTTNVRELAEILWRALGSSPGNTLEAPEDLLPVARPAPREPAQSQGATAITREQILAVLERCDGIKEVAWRELGLRNRFQLHRLLKRLGIE
ncbi:MAG: sigma 54-interacting transcriptional regulator [Nannocystaceae bacterium]